MGRRGPIEKHILDARRVRRIRDGFSWLDRRFIGDGWVESLRRNEIALYLFLVSVSDRDGLSFYSDPRIAGTLKISIEEVVQARGRLLELELIAYEAPLYQVLALDDRRRPQW